jgi:hypothetical protein
MFTDTLPRLGVLFTDRLQPNAPVRLGRLIGEALCALHGHEMLLQLEPGRIRLCCMNCGHRTPGWNFQQESS